MTTVTGDGDLAAPAVDVTPADDPFVQQLVAENARLRARVATLERRLGMYVETYDKIAQTVWQAQHLKGVEG